MTTTPFQAKDENDPTLLPATETNFENKDSYIWDKLQEYKVLDEIFSVLQAVPKWIKVKFIGDKLKPRVIKYADEVMPDAVAKLEGFSLNPQWLSVRKDLIPLVMKYQVTRSATVEKVEGDDQKRLPSPEEQTLVEDEIVEAKAKRAEAAATQAEALERLKKRSG